ncbi:MAG: hypothetical protein GWN71_05810, partial [Gammaproteobacteria bacterium]|nr:hypothetical protein [Gemmatimonadota bacterium]NIU73102.1 hypothetical protein [Gammaproteobacteria bacterium]
MSLRYVAGSMGLDEHGGIRLSFRDTTDFGGFQFHDPAGDNYVAAYTREGLRLHLEFSRKGNIRPYRKALYIHVLDGSLNEGEEIRLVFGDRSQGSRGWRLQTCVEQDFHALVESDPLGTHDYVVLPDRLAFDIVPGPGYRYRLNVPTRVQAGEPVRLRVKCEDLWGNPLRSLDARPAVTCAGVDDGTAGEPLAVAPTHEDGVLTYALEAPAAPGLYHYAIADGEVRGDTSNPMVVLPPGGDAGLRYYWGDYHGQTGETVGTGSVEDYFHFGRHFGFLDGSCHQGNDFQIDGPTWARIV